MENQIDIAQSQAVAEDTTVLPVEPITEPAIMQETVTESIPNSNEPFLTIKHNHEEKPLTKDEAIAFAQKGIDYDDKKASHQEFLELAQLNGFSDIKEYSKFVREQAQQKQVEQYESQGYSSEVAAEQVKRDERLAVLERENAESKTLKATNEKYESDFATFQKEYPNVDISKLPNDVLKEVNDTGVPLIYVYAKYINKIVAQKTAADAINLSNSNVSMGSMTTESTVEKDFYTSKEWDNLSSESKDRLIKSGQADKMMAKW
jgi:hypothetical protein